MAKVYANLIKKGLKTIDAVPAALKKAVQALLDDSALAELAAYTEPVVIEKPEANAEGVINEGTVSEEATEDAPNDN